MFAAVNAVVIFSVEYYPYKSELKSLIYKIIMLINGDDRY